MSKSTFRPPAETQRIGEFPIGRDSKLMVDILRWGSEPGVLSLRKHIAGVDRHGTPAWFPTRNGAVFAVNPHKLDTLIGLLLEARQAIEARGTGDYLADEALAEATAARGENAATPC